MTNPNPAYLLVGMTMHREPDAKETEGSLQPGAQRSQGM